MLIQVVLNGSRSQAEHPAIPVTPEQMAQSARAAADEGAGAIHLHVRDSAGRQSLSPADVAQVVEHVHAACPGLPVCISVRADLVPDARQRHALLDSWQVLPDEVSISVADDGWLELAQRLIARGIGVEVGVSSPETAQQLIDSGLIDRCQRVLAELGDADASDNFEAIKAVLHQGVLSIPLLVHGQDGSAWEMIRIAARLNYDIRVGFEDTLLLPDGTPATSNAALVRAAIDIATDAKARLIEE